MRYGVIVADFGFTLSATRAISLVRHQPDDVAKIFWSTIVARVALLLLSAAIIWPIAEFIPILRANLELTASCGLLVVGAVLFPQWYFQGLERMRVIALIYLLVRVISLIAIFAFVRSPADDLAAAIILSGQQVIAAIISLGAIQWIAPLKFFRPRMQDVVEALRSSWHLFLANAAGSLYLNSNAFLLGIFAGPNAVAIYSLANRIALAIFNLMAPIVQAVYPRASLLFSQSTALAFVFVKRIFKFVGPAAIALSALSWVFAPWMVNVLGGHQYIGATPILRIMSVLPAALTLASFLAQIVMINVGLARALSKIYLVIGLLNLILMPPLVSWYGASGAALSLVIVEIIGPLLMLNTIRRSGIMKNPPVSAV